MGTYSNYKRVNIAQMRPITEQEINQGLPAMLEQDISVSEADRKNGSPKKGDMIARNPNNHDDKWLVANDYFEENFEEV